MKKSVPINNPVSATQTEKEAWTEPRRTFRHVVAGQSSNQIDIDNTFNALNDEKIPGTNENEGGDLIPFVEK